MPYPVVVRFRAIPSTLHESVKRSGGFFGVCIVSYLFVWLVSVAVNPNGPNAQKQIDGEIWASTSHSWLDRVSCHWLGICGGINWLISTWVFRRTTQPQIPRGSHQHQHEWEDTTSKPQEWSQTEIESRVIPEYVLKHAPVLYLDENEQWWPTDVADFLHHVRYRQNGKTKADNVQLSTMTKILARDHIQTDVFLQSLDDPEELPDWITSAQNKPTEQRGRTLEPEKHNASSTRERQMIMNADSRHTSDFQAAWNWRSDEQRRFESSGTQKPAHSYSWSVENDSQPSARSPAPAFLITVAKGNNTLDAFWFFFYAFNRGARVTGIQYGNHVGDWEHVLVRFHAQKPVSLFLSAHEWGSAYKFEAMEKYGSAQERPVIYAGLGSHAHYATPGKHAYALPLALLGDTCSRGYLWDPILNLISFVHNPKAKGWPVDSRFKASMHNPRVHTSWLEYHGHWGDKRFSLNDRKGRNYRFAGEYKYLNGPTGPWDKALNRSTICEHAEKPCQLRDTRDGYVGPLEDHTDLEDFILGQ